VHELVWASDAGPVRGWVARIDLTDPRVEVVVTDALDPGTGPVPEGVEARLEATDAWAAREGLALAVNANFFAWKDAPGQPRGESGWADVIGLSASDGVVVSPPRSYNGQSDVSLAFDEQGRATIGTPADRVFDAVSGVGPSDAAPGLSALLVTAGTNTGASHRVAPLARHPRTAAGIDAAGETLWLMVIDGRQDGWSVGVTLPELADLLIREGVAYAINLDGGGSSSFYYDPSGPGAAAPAIENRPSDGGHRAVANHLGVRLHPGPHTPLQPEKEADR
jgi:exopolysaccharide biosynthesis protein